ncbi:unnamed protein product [Toxocara canis]|uniref:Thioredoxin domain-containing protein n=1 Tax=Toxocara canis TaxID=6265 RepID=A0A183V4L8_TOXCA|nr:unnamed protein product [Toxocara canis]
MNDDLAGCEFRNADGEIVKGRDAMEDKLLGLYFSAHWCIWCRRFTPILKEFYEQLGNDEFEIVFVSADKSEAALMKYYREAQGKWLYLPYGRVNGFHFALSLTRSPHHWSNFLLITCIGQYFIVPTNENESHSLLCFSKLWRKYEVRTMPTLIIVRANGEVITRNGVSHLKVSCETANKSDSHSYDSNFYSFCCDYFVEKKILPGGKFKCFCVRCSVFITYKSSCFSSHFFLN